VKIHLGAELIRADIERTKEKLKKEGKSDKIKQRSKKLLKAVREQGKKVETIVTESDELPARFRYEKTLHPRRPE